MERCESFFYVSNILRGVGCVVEPWDLLISATAGIVNMSMDNNVWYKYYGKNKM